MSGWLIAWLIFVTTVNLVTSLFTFVVLMTIANDEYLLRQMQGRDE